MGVPDSSIDTAAAASPGNDLAGSSIDIVEQANEGPLGQWQTANEEKTSSEADKEDGWSVSSSSPDGSHDSSGDKIIVTPEQIDHSGHAEANHTHHGSDETEKSTFEDASNGELEFHDDANVGSSTSQDSAVQDAADAASDFHGSTPSKADDEPPMAPDVSVGSGDYSGPRASLVELPFSPIPFNDPTTQLIRDEIAQVYHDYHSLSDAVSIGVGVMMLAEAVAVGTAVEGLVVLTASQQATVIGGVTIGSGQVLSGSVNLLSHAYNQQSIKSTHNATAYVPIQGLGAGFCTAVATGNSELTQKVASIASAMPGTTPGPSNRYAAIVELLRNSADGIDAISELTADAEKSNGTKKK